MAGRAWLGRLAATTVAAAAMASATSIAAAAGAPSISVPDLLGIPDLVGTGVNNIIMGVAHHAPKGAVAVLEQRSAGIWRVYTTAALQYEGTFDLNFQPIVSGKLVD